MEQTYFGKISRAAKSECMNRRKIRLIILIMTVTAALFEIGEYSVNDYSWVQNDVEEITRHAHFSGFFGMFLMFAAAFFGAFAVFGVFSDLTSRQTADVQLSLPMSAKDRYLSKILAMVRLHILPLTIAGLAVAVIGNLIHGSFDLIGYLLQYHAVVLAVAMFVDAICIFCMCCCGAKAEGVYTSIITGLCVSFTPYLFFTLGVLEFSGIDVDNISFTKAFSLLGLLNFLWTPEIADETSAAEPWLWLIGNMLVSSLLMFASFYIYRRRDGRQVGKPMVYGIFMELFMFIGLFTLFTMFFYTGSWGIGMTIAAIIYLIIRIVSARAKITPKLFASWIGKYALSLAVFTVIMGAAYFSGGFGYYKIRQTEVKTDTVNFSVDVSKYEKIHGNGYSSVTDSASFNNTLVIDPLGKSSTGYYGDWSVCYVVDNASDIEVTLDELNRIIDKYHTMDRRSIGGFFEVMTNGSLSSYRYRYERECAYVTVYINSYDSVEVEGYRNETYRAEFMLNKEEYEEICSDLKEVLTRTDDNHAYYDWEIYD